MRTRAFSLLELVIVVAVLGIVASIAVPRLSRGAQGASAAAVASSLRTLADAVLRYEAQTATRTTDWHTARVPNEMTPFIDPAWVAAPTPLGGHWDVERNDSGVRFAVGIAYESGDTPPEDRLQSVDALLDDGDLATGRFRRIAVRRYYLVIED